MELLITFFQSYLLAPLLIIILFLVMGSLKGLKEQLSMKYALLYILIAGLLLGTPGFLSVLQDEYVWGGYLHLCGNLLHFRSTCPADDEGRRGKVARCFRQAFRTSLHPYCVYDPRSMDTLPPLYEVWGLALWAYCHDAVPLVSHSFPHRV